MLRRRVLVVDDEPRLLHVIESFLGMEGYDVTTCPNAEEALAVIDGQRPDMVILDINMPGMDGIEVCRRIKAHAPHIPILVFSGRGNVQDSERARNAGADDFLEKPFNLDGLAAVVRRHLGEEAATPVGESATDQA